MSPDLFLTVLLSLMVKQKQVAQMIHEIGEVTANGNAILAQLDNLEKIPMTQAVSVEIKRVERMAVGLNNLVSEFSAKLFKPYQPNEQLLSPWLEFVQTFIMGTELTENNVVKLGLELISDERIKPIIELDVTKLQKEWKRLNLINRFKVCSETLDDISSTLYNETENIVLN